jgi:multidrug efflux pump subunit AcrA (membrane-fusion protein)
LFAAIAVVSLAACDTQQSAVTQATSATQTVTVTRRDITEIVALPSTVVAVPRFLVPAPVTGYVKHGRDMFTVDGQAVPVVVTGHFEQWLVADGAMVAAGVPVAQWSYAGFGMAATLPAQDAYRLLSGELKARASITGGHGPFDCAVLVTPPAEGAGFICAIPLEVKAFAGLQGTIALSSRQARQVLALPVTAVSGTIRSGEVAVLGPDGEATIVKVSLGVTDGSHVEITSGLTEGATVLAAAPPLEGLP